ncbi:hypothetical protein OESDEN_06886 [Oesophagostomum dentatum]|uniref:Uncharacterized protein n=1 Tax=Oesophagostomum dentatum TaxID=61180 RepID=A0A0B1T6P1_OESDE|nr:hypothetical protein OESDEN_06886 [Oesophagostomum dentatum]
MTEALKKKYGNKPISRAKVVQKLIDMRPAANNAGSCTLVFDRIRMLINQMFPYSFVKNVLISTQEKEEIKIEDIMEQLEKQIDTKKYVELRLRIFTKGEYPKKRIENSHSEQDSPAAKSCVFCKSGNHVTGSCKAVIDVQSRRNAVRDEKIVLEALFY